MTSDEGTWRKAFLDSALDAVVIIDEMGAILEFNLVAEEMFGFQRDQVLGKCVGGVIIPPDLRGSHASGMERMRTSGVGRILGKRLELPACRSDGSQFLVELVVNRVNEPAGAIFVGTIRDISAQKRHEEALRSSESRFRALADAAPVMIWQGAFDGHISWFNRVWLDFTGMSLEQAVGLGWMESIHPDDLENLLRQYHQALDNRGKLSIEYRLKNRSGKYHWVFTNMTPSINESGSLIGYAGSCVDIQSRYESQEQQRLMQFTLDRAGDGVFIIAEDSTVHYVNDSACQMSGYSREELVGKSVSEFTVGIDWEGWQDHWSKLRRWGQFTFDANHRRKDGTLYPVEINVNLIKFQDREFSCAFVRDNTERQVAEEELTSAVREAQSANRAKSEFLAMVSHEMRTPLNGILGLLSLTIETTLNEDQSGMLNVCRKSGEQLKKLIDDMLDFSQIERRQFSLVPKNCDLHELLERLNDVHSEQVLEKKLEFRWNVDSDVPKWIICDSQRIYQVIDNMLSNASKFTSQGYVAFHASVEAESTDVVELRFTVEDSGIGINSADTQRIFRKFERVDASATRDQGGLGLGLAICHQLANQMNGKMTFEKNAEQGSRFHFTSRFATSHDSPASLSFSTEQRFAITNSKVRFSNVTVLLAEDDEPSQMVAKQILERSGAEVIVACNGLEAVKLYSQFRDRISAIFMDIMMPQLDGVSAQQEIRSAGGRNLPIIAMTAQAMKGDREHFIEAGFDSYVSKPISRGRVVRALADALPESALQFPAVNPDVSRGRGGDLSKLFDQCGRDHEHMVAVIKCFNRACGESISQINDALDKRDVAELVSVAHRLRGSVANMCAAQTLIAAEAVEQLARSSNIDQLILEWPRHRSDLLDLCRELGDAI